ncbi:MAG: hypothetical protein L3V56_06665 [Candidatus Magnetoovum sp. WYHC-5]|nr:hypothetical protein [Candidatus Magnetoovum sp. WYHC-5]
MRLLRLLNSCLCTYFAVFSLLILLLFIIPEKSLAITMQLTSKSYMLLQEDARDNDYAPFYEYYELDLKDIKEGLISVHSGGWLRYDLKTVSDEEREVDELTYLYLKLSPLKDKSLTFQIGRHYVFSGVATEQIDGLSGLWEITPLTGISIFGGLPVETENDGRDDDYIVGGRVSQKIADKAQLGLSYLKSYNDDQSHREEMGVDTWLGPVDWMELDGLSSYNNLDNEWMEHSYYVRFFPMKNLIISPLYSHVDYGSAFYNTTLSVFTPEYLGKDESITKYGGYVEYNITSWLTAIPDYIHYGYDELGNSNYYGAKLAFDVYGINSGVMLHRMAGHVKQLRYTEARVFAVKTFKKLKLALDAINLNYDEEYNGLRNMYNLNGTAEYDITKYLNLTASVDYAKTPDFTHKTSAFFKVVYNFDKTF